MNLAHTMKRLSRVTLDRSLGAYQRLAAKSWTDSGSFYCPVCQHSAKRFLPYGDPPRAFAKCPTCGSLERHRLDWLLFEKHTDLFSGKPLRMLHVAPEAFLAERFKALPNLDYLSADLYGRQAMVAMDITQINYPDNSFSVIYCSHVLEHVEEDRRAIQEFFRVLKPGGWALLQVPITVQKTYEDPSIRDPEERHKHFGQRDHVRRCGPDYIERMREAGFDAQSLRATDLVTTEDCIRLGFQPDRLLFFCIKPVTVQQPSATAESAQPEEADV